MDIREKIESIPGLQDALIALSFFRHRNDRVSRFMKAKKKHNQVQTKSTRREYVRTARDHIRKARELGWKGSIVEEFNQKSKGGEVKANV